MSGDRLDVALAAAGLARSRTHARRIIEEGRARLDGRPASKPSLPVPPGARLEVVEVPDGVEFASRAAHKLAGALDTLGLDPAGLCCLDAGASTGGFTDVLLRRGAAHVLAVDIGHDQLVAHVREDPRVEVHDGTSVRDLTPELVGGPVDLLVADLSFISLRTVMPALAGVVRDGENGWQYRGEADFRRKLDNFLAHPHRREQISRQARQSAEEYSAKRFAERVEAIYLEQIARCTVRGIPA